MPTGVHRGRRGPPCSVCIHRERASIDLALVRGVSPTAIAKRYDVGVKALQRHKQRETCLPPQLKAKLIAGPDVAGLDIEKIREAEGQSLLLHLVNQRNRIFAAFDSAEEAGHIHGIVRVSSELRSIQELIAKIVGQLGTGTINQNLFILPSYLELRMVLIRALADHPQARADVAAALHSLEAQAAKDISSETRALQFAVDARKVARTSDAQEVADEAR